MMPGLNLYNNAVCACAHVSVGGWLNLLVEFLFSNRNSTRKWIYNARNVTTSNIIINSVKLIIHSISPLQTHSAETWSFCLVKMFLTVTLIVVRQGQDSCYIGPAGPLLHCCIISFLNSAI